MNRRWLSKASSSRSSMLVEGVGQVLELVVRARRGRCGADRSVAWISRATPVMRPIGRSTRPATSQPTTEADEEQQHRGRRTSSSQEHQRPLVHAAQHLEVLDARRRLPARAAPLLAGYWSPGDHVRC